MVFKAESMPSYSLSSHAKPLIYSLLTSSVKIYNWKYEFTPGALTYKPRSHNFSIILPFAVEYHSGHAIHAQPHKKEAQKGIFNYTSDRRGRRQEARLTYLLSENV